MKEVMCGWYSLAKKRLEELKSDIYHFEKSLRYIEENPIYFRYDYKIALFGNKTDWSLKTKSYELKSDISLSVLIKLLKYEKENLELLIEGIKDEDFKCCNCQRQHGNCRNYHNIVDCENDFCITEELEKEIIDRVRKDKGLPENPEIEQLEKILNKL